MRAEVEAKIRVAFKGVRRGRGVSLKQAELIDQRNAEISDAAFRALPQSENTDRWQALPLSELERDNISHLDAEGFRYYIPAFMISVLESYDSVSLRVIGTLSALYPKQSDWEYHMHQYSALNEAQRVAIAGFLIGLPALIELDPEDLRIVQRGVRNYWHQFAQANAHGT